MSEAQLRPPLTKPRRTPPKTVFWEDAAAPLGGKVVRGIPPDSVGFGTLVGSGAENDFVFDNAAVPEVAEAPVVIPVDPGAGLIKALEVI